MRAPPLLLATGLSLATAATKTRASAPAIPVPAACPDTSVCPPQPRTVLAIEGGDPGAAFATLYYLYVVNGVQYAWHKGYVPYIVFNATWMQQTMGTAAADAPPLWEHFFRSYCPGVGPWLARCSNVVAVRPPRDWWVEQVHGEFKWSVRAWYYGTSSTVYSTVPGPVPVRGRCLKAVPVRNRCRCAGAGKGS